MMHRHLFLILIILYSISAGHLEGQSGESRSKIVIINSREKKILDPATSMQLPEIKWISPASLVDATKFPVIEISGIVSSPTRLTGLNLIINGELLNDGKSFSVLPGATESEYSFSRTVNLTEGSNSLVVEASNVTGSRISESRVVNFEIARIDEKYSEKRLALVIGNADYVNGNILQNPVNDALAVKEALSEVGFKVMHYINADQRTMKKAMDEFGEQLKGYNIGLFYYAGHGIQVKGNNYLIPVDAQLKVEQDVEYDCIDAGRILGKMEAAGTETNIVILDACRNNPFERQWGGRAAGQGNGLAFMSAPSGSIIAYATSPGKTASDGAGKNGLYTSALLQFIKIPGLSIEEFFKNVRTTVEKNSNRTQTPWESTSLKGNFYFRLR
jgi:hypothetical protein